MPKQPVAWGNHTERILDYLRKAPATIPQLVEALGITPNTVSSTMWELKRVGLRGPHKGKRRVHIIGWMREAHAGKKAYLRAVFAEGHGRDVRKPPPLTYTQKNARRTKREKTVSNL